jgi:hypothetical protein
MRPSFPHTKRQQEGGTIRSRAKQRNLGVLQRDNLGHPLHVRPVSNHAEGIVEGGSHHRGDGED